MIPILRTIIHISILFLIIGMAQASSDIEKIIDFTLKELHPEIPYTKTAKNLLLLTVSVESDYGKADLKKSLGRNIGVFQIAPRTFIEIQKWAHDNGLKQKLNKLKEISEIHFHAALARIHYFMRIKNIPKIKNNDIWKMAWVWKTHYNTYKGEGTIEEAIIKYNLYCRRK